jgi:serine/threonine protein kinase
MNWLCDQVLEQMLSALDFLAFNKLCHRDVKPDNILYDHAAGKGYHFQLADFGLSNHHSQATTFCGTSYFQAPELYTELRCDTRLQSPKMDVWSLFTSLIAIHNKVHYPPFGTQGYGKILQAARAGAIQMPWLEPMAREDPKHRASAAQMLVTRFGGQGLTTPRADVLPLLDAPQRATAPTQRSSKTPRQRGAPPLIVYPRREQQDRHRRPEPQSPVPLSQRARGSDGQEPLPIRPHWEGVSKRRSESAKPETHDPSTRRRDYISKLL